MNQEMYDKGLKIRRATLGNAYVDETLKNVNAFTKELQEYVTTYCWGEIWGREGLDRKTRSIINLAMISALNRPHELALHVRGALNNGVKREEIKEVFLQVGAYAGAPAMIDSFRVAQAVFKDVEGA